MKLKYIVLICLLLLSAVTYASPYGVQVPMSSPQPMQASYRPSQTVINMSSTSRTATMQGGSYRPSGHFTSSVPTLNSYGAAQAPTSYTPGHTGPRRVSGNEGDTEDEITAEPNGDSSIAPIGDVPWLFMFILLAAYVFYHRKRQSTSKFSSLL